jgi:Uma2 family endonuclease
MILAGMERLTNVRGVMTPIAVRTAPPQAAPAIPAAPPALTPADNPRVLLDGIRWETYEALLADLSDRKIRLTYDRGSLEIMAPLYRHEKYAEILGRLAVILAEELNIEFVAAGSTTFRQKAKRRGLEADRSYYVQHAAAIIGKLDIDLKVDPPPDLAIEMDVTSSSLDRMGIYGSLGVPEVWRFDGEEFQVWRRKRDGSYRRATASAAFPTLPVAKVLPLLDELAPLGGLAMTRALRAWVRANAMPKS